MPIYRDKEAGCFVFEFDRRIDGRRVRTRKHLPRAWNKTQADAFDRKEAARLYATATGLQREEHSVEDAVNLYIKHRCPELKSGDSAKQELASVYWAYKGQPLSQLPQVCQKIAEEWHGVMAPATIRNRIRYLTAACRYAWKNHNVCDHDPAERVSVPEVDNDRHVYISREQMMKIVRAVKSDPRHENMALIVRSIIRIAFYSGMRLAEILRAEPVGQCFHLKTTKNGRPRVIPIHPSIAWCLWIYGKARPAKTTVQKHFRSARDASGVPDLHFHDLRHSSASEMVNAGVQLYTVGRVLGHMDSRSTQRYAHLATDTLADAIGTIGRKIPQSQKQNAA